MIYSHAVFGVELLQNMTRRETDAGFDLLTAWLVMTQ